MEEMDMELVERLVSESPKFRMLFEEHQLLEKELNEFEKKRYLTPEEELERKKIQKIKLAGKDEMTRLMRGYSISVN
ncbi:YdcH family protein [Geoalkalibacter halelectricus]|uniref:YdcH family protein n=1 Tax=Geoalkalibacter halelectricus TaxID=2847045 RepID=A0ABY5ZJ13_9BACT|nr:YdcH family protein [Geoalkalibacter halelectricus]MDO3379407.1 YdcH family protein [Geoalkalibacter halelectricus]UWZ78716.1 YdcH family protein [Geoalkalibacter halelectricus]